MYVMVWCGATIAHAVVATADTSAMAQITCTSVQRSQPGFVRAQAKGPATALWGAGFARCYPKMQQAVLRSVRSTLPALVTGAPSARTPAARGGGGGGGGGAAQADADDDGVVSAQHFGYDFVVDADERPWLLEANVAPQIGDMQSMAQLRHVMGLPLINGIVELLVNRRARSSAQGWDWVGDLANDTVRCHTPAPTQPATTGLPGHHHAAASSSDTSRAQRVDRLGKATRDADGGAASGDGAA
eukprot:COSAG01_NODE_4636_length_4847_cov_10.889916_3_plen_244_part_00